MNKVSAYMLVKDEAWFIKHALGSVLACVDDVLIVDFASVDGTKDIAEEYARCYSHVRVEHAVQEGPRYSAAWLEGHYRRYCVDKLEHDWVFVIDGDEYYDGHPDLLRTFNKPLSLPTINIGPGGTLITKVGETPWYPDLHVRLYDRRTHWWSEVKHGGVTSATGTELGSQTDATLWHYHALGKEPRRTATLTNPQAFNLVPLSRRIPVSECDL